MAKIDGERFSGEQVDRNGISGKGVDGQYVEIFWRLGGQRQTRIDHDNFGAGRSVTQKCEEGSGELARQGIDLVEAEGVTGFAVSGQRSGAEAHYTDSCRHSTVKVQRQA